jgi:hypothetical protein
MNKAAALVGFADRLEPGFPQALMRRQQLVQVVELHDAERAAAERTIDDHECSNLARGES